jgi:hypothetical protein
VFHINYSIVFVAKGHTPGTYNSDFLKRKQVVPEDWDERQQMSVPPFSDVQYSNSIQIQSDPEKFKILDLNPDPNAESAVPEIAAKLAALLIDSAVTISAVGINFLVACPMNNAAGWIREQFIARDLEIDREQGPPNVSLKVAYVGRPALTLKIEPGEYARAVEKKGGNLVCEVIAVDANFHRDVKENEADVLADLTHFKDDQDRLLKWLADMGLCTEE